MNIRQPRFISHPVRQAARRARKGFALIVTLSLMTLLLILVLALVTLVQLNLNSAKTNLYNTQAKQNALLAAYIAVGQLQKFAGPDQRVTTTADIGRTGDTNEKGANLNSIGGFFTGFGLNTFNSNPAPLSPTPPPFGANNGYSQGGTRFWTAVWGPGANPLNIYNGTVPPVLLNWLVSGDEGTPLTAAMYGGGKPGNGVVAPPPTASMTYGSNTSAIISQGTPDYFTWNALTSDITILPIDKSKPAASAVVLVGPNTANTNDKNPKLSITAGKGGPATILTAINEANNMIVAPVVPIIEPAEASSGTVTNGRYAWYVQDEGVKAKYNVPDPNAGQTSVSTAGLQGQTSRYRYFSPERSGIERMLDMDTYNNTSGGASVNSPTAYNATAATQLSNMLDSAQIPMIDKNLQGVETPTQPQQTLRLHYHDFTPYSYGVIADSLRGGLRYDLTAAFEETAAGTTNNVFNDPNNGLFKKTILPALATAASAALSTEPNVVQWGGNSSALGSTTGLKNTDGSNFHGPSAPELTAQVNSSRTPTTTPGLKWDVVNSYYNLASSNTGTPANTPIKMRSADNTHAGISPVILEARLRFGQYVDSNNEEYFAVQPLFVLANPYNFPIADPGGGLDLGYRINTDTGMEWGVAADARNTDRVAPHGNGVGFTIGYDTTQNVAKPLLAENASFGSQYFYSSQGVVNNIANPGYYPLLKNPVSFPTFVFPGSPTGNTGYNSALDNVAFHIPHTDAQGKQLVFMPGEAKVFILADKNHRGIDETTYFTVTGYVPDPNVVIVAAVGTSLATNQHFYLTGNQIIPVPLMQFIPQSNQPQDLYMLRDTGIAHGSNALRLLPSAVAMVNSLNITISKGNTIMSPVTDAQIQAYAAVKANLWPATDFGYISTAFPSVAMTLELRYDLTDITPTSHGAFGSVLPVLAGIGSPSNGNSYNVAGVGLNLLQSITNIDLTGDGYFPNKVYDPAGSINLQPTQGYRRQFIGTSKGGHLPAFLMDWGMAMSMPGKSFDPADGEPLQMQTDVGASTNQGVTVNFDPGQQGTYRTYYDYNLRAANMNLPPFVPLNTGTISPNAVLPAASGFICLPPYGRFFSQGPGADNTVNPLLGNPSYTYGLGHEAAFDGSSNNPQGSSSNPNANFSADTGWGYSLGGSNANNVAPGPQFTILYGIPTRGTANAGGLAPNPNGPSVPDVAMVSLGQLQHADLTADDFWVSVGYQPGNAFGNSYSSFYVSRNATVQSHQAQAWAKNILVTPAPGINGFPGPVFLKNTSTTANAYDISYLLNAALWDRYFFSTLSQTAQTLLPANNRLKYAAGYTPTGAQLGITPGSNVAVQDAATGLQMFRAYAPARYLMIDGAFNINSTSVEAWKAVLSALRGVPYNTASPQNNKANGTDVSSSGSQVVYFPRNIVSPDLAAETNNGAPVNTPVDLSNNSQVGRDDAPSYAGFRQLTDNDIDVLAVKIVQQIRYRGPFLSLAQFVNRRITPLGVNAINDPTSISGALQTAIDISSAGTALPSLNNFANATIGGGTNANGNGFSNSTMDSTLIPGTGVGNLTLVYPDGASQLQATPYPKGSADPFSRLVGIPGWLTQADILEALGPILAARSDTFVIRTYGEVLDPSINQKDIVGSIATNPNFVLSRAWCELVVQRIPDYVATDKNSLNDPSVTSGWGAPNPAAAGNYNGNNGILSAVNATFGRRFRIVSVKWLSPTDI
jgi:hypothetical protein